MDKNGSLSKIFLILSITKKFAVESISVSLKNGMEKGELKEFIRKTDQWMND